VSSLTVENYVKSIYQASHAQLGKPAATGQIAAMLQVSPGTVTSMLKTLSESGLASYTPYEGARLTTAGEALALRVLRRHRLVELFLVRTLDLTWDQVHEEAEHLEHAVSDFLVDRIDEMLGRPAVDPHGDPIPKADGTVAGSDARPLSEAPAGTTFRVARVVDQSPEFLRFLTLHGLTIDATGLVDANDEQAGVVALTVGGRPLSLGRDVATRLLVSPAPR
jgi:DtxR family Mn-dependent transcriptional regulator